VGYGKIIPEKTGSLARGYPFFSSRISPYPTKPLSSTIISEKDDNRRRARKSAAGYGGR
jgi:hypothetical protein